LMLGETPNIALLMLLSERVHLGKCDCIVCNCLLTLNSCSDNKLSGVVSFAKEDNIYTFSICKKCMISEKDVFDLAVKNIANLILEANPDSNAHVATEDVHNEGSLH
jgi:hypothetical protein